MRTLLQNLRGVITLLLIFLSTLAHGFFLCVLGLLKFVVPEGSAQNRVRSWLTWFAESWIGFNNRLLGSYRSMKWDLDLPDGLDPDGCYLVVSNHQSWVDILVLQRCFNRRLPLLRFFLKQSLIWVPVLGLCWWALDFPFMRRASREQVLKRPELRNADLESARRACEKFSTVPVAMMSFLEGTRATPEKLAASQASFRHLLAPRYGGAGQVMYALGERLDGCVDVTILYPRARHQTAPSFWDLLTGRLREIVAVARVHEIPPVLLGKNFREDEAAREAIKSWLNELWSEKDEWIETRLS